MNENPHFMVANEFSGAPPKQVTSPNPQFPLLREVAMQNINDTERPRFNYRAGARIIKKLIR